MSQIAIRPYVTGKPNMGLEKYKQVLFEGAEQKHPIWAKEDIPGSGKVRYITGLDEFAPELEKFSPDVKKAKVKQIREKVSKLEAVISGVEIKVDDKNFWDKVKALHPHNSELWDKIRVTVSNNPNYLDPTEMTDLIIISAIEAGGVQDIAPSLEAAKKSGTYKFYLDKSDETAKMEATLAIVEDEARGILVDLYKNDKNKLFYISKVLDQNSVQYTKRTSSDIMYTNMRSYIEGKTSDRFKKDSAKYFISIAEEDLGSLKLRALVKDASYTGHLLFRNGQIYEVGTDISLGSDPSEAVEFLKNPLNDAILAKLLDPIEEIWNN